MTKRNSILNRNRQSFPVLPQEDHYGLSNEKIIAFLSEIIPKYCSNQSLVQVCRKRARYLAATYRNVNPAVSSSERSFHDELEDVAMILEDFLGVSSSADTGVAVFPIARAVPPAIIADAHTQIGLIRYEQECHSGAIESLLKALWIRKSLPEEPDKLMVLCHKLGVAYTHMGEFIIGKALLHRSMDYHRKSHFARDVFFISDTKRLLAKLEILQNESS